MKTFKGFNKDLTCTPDGDTKFQYEIGKEYHEPEADLCSTGFHACEFPLDCFGYYSPSQSRYCEVELDEVSEEKSGDSKRVGKRIHIKAEIGLPGLIKAGVDYVKEHVDWEHAKESNTGYQSAATNTGDQSAATNTGNQSAATNTGNRSAATNTGDQSAATNTGYRSAATNTGDQSAATNTGNQSAATNTGNQSAATNTGDQSAATNTGDRSAATNTGYRSAATNTGYQSAAVVSGSDSVALAMGIESSARGAVGCYLVLAEWYRDSKHDWHIKDLKSVKVDGEVIKADTFYRLVNGEFVEVGDNDVGGSL